jgi:putative transcriptional regulator
MKAPLKAPLGKGIFLVATPGLRDPNFRQTVVLLCEHGAEGALGVVVNRPTAMSVSEALPHVPVLEGQRHVLFSGGPVQPNQVMLLYRLEQLPDNSHHVFDGVCLGGDMELVDKILTTNQGREAFRAYIGYSGWGPGQLESEMKTGSWITIPADPAVVFEKDPARVWSEILSTLGEEYRLYADMPFDPSLN